jgi:hypothetical protein
MFQHGFTLQNKKEKKAELRVNTVPSEGRAGDGNLIISIHLETFNIIEFSELWKCSEWGKI